MPVTECIKWCAKQLHGALLMWQKPDERVQQRGFSGTVSPQYRDGFPTLHMYVNVAQDRIAAPRDVEIFGFY